jgi:DNA-binding transcriptional ArsR family regulator
MGHGIEGRAHSGILDAATARQVAETMQALATTSRVRILGRLRHAPCAVGELAGALAAGVPNRFCGTSRKAVKVTGC